MSELLVTEGSKLSIHFALKLRDGSVVDSNFETRPASLVLGDGNLLPGFERCLLGMRSGQRETFVIAPEQGFGQRNPNNLQEFPRSTFAPDLALSEGLVLSFADAQRAELPGVVAAFDDEKVTVDFNHPLAGQEILFDVQVLSVEAA